MNGRVYDIRLTKFDLTMIEFDWKNKHRVANPDKVFSIVDSTGKTSYVYMPTLADDPSVVQMGNFLKGYNDGRKYRWGSDFAIGFVSGAGGSFLGPIYGWSIPIGAGVINSSFKPRIRDRHVSYPDLRTDEFYQNGIRKKIKQRKAMATFLGGATGMVVGTILFQFILSDFNP